MLYIYTAPHVYIHRILYGSRLVYPIFRTSFAERSVLLPFVLPCNIVSVKSNGMLFVYANYCMTAIMLWAMSWERTRLNSEHQQASRLSSRFPLSTLTVTQDVYVCGSAICHVGQSCSSAILTEAQGLYYVRNKWDKAELGLVSCSLSVEMVSGTDEETGCWALVVHVLNSGAFRHSRKFPGARQLAVDTANTRKCTNK